MPLSCISFELQYTQQIGGEGVRPCNGECSHVLVFCCCVNGFRPVLHGRGGNPGDKCCYTGGSRGLLNIDNGWSQRECGVYQWLMIGWSRIAFGGYIALSTGGSGFPGALQRLITGWSRTSVGGYQFLTAGGPEISGAPSGWCGWSKDVESSIGRSQLGIRPCRGIFCCRFLTSTCQ